MQGSRRGGLCFQKTVYILLCHCVMFPVFSIVGVFFDDVSSLLKTQPSTIIYFAANCIFNLRLLLTIGIECLLASSSFSRCLSLFFFLLTFRLWFLTGVGNKRAAHFLFSFNLDQFLLYEFFFLQQLIDLQV